MEIEYIKGDATSPGAEGNKIIVHVCNDIGGWGKGFVNAISAKWSEPEKQYREWHRSGNGFALGQVQFVKVKEDIWVANMIGQRDIKRSKEGPAPVRYEAIDEALDRVQIFASQIQASVHMPRIGCGLAGGSWDKMETIVKQRLTDREISVTVYDFE
ncbi:MAG: macro domain-containing protein [Ferruginibacter sp.]